MAKETASDPEPEEPDFESSEMQWELENYGLTDDPEAVPVGVRLRNPDDDWPMVAFSDGLPDQNQSEKKVSLSKVQSYLRLIRSSQEQDDDTREQRKISQLIRESGFDRDDVMDLLRVQEDLGEEKVEELLRGPDEMVAARTEVRARIERLFDKSAG